MNSSNSPEKLLDLIYAAPGDQRRWTEMLAVLAQSFGASGAHIIQLDPTHRHQLEASTGVPKDGLNLYESHYAALDPWAIAGKRTFQEGMVWSGEELISLPAMLHTEFYNDFGHHYAIFHEVGACLLRDDTEFAALTLHRARNYGAFGDEALGFLRMIVPHLQRALRLHHRMLDLQAMNDTLSGAFDSIPIGLVLLSRSKILAVNRVARDICSASKCLELSSTGIHAVASYDDRLLQRSIASARDAALGNSGGGTVLITRESGDPLVVVVSPIRRGAWPAGTKIAVFITDRKHPADFHGGVLRTAFGLTPAETRLASILVNGSSLAQVADELGVSLNTVRTQIKSIFAKTNTARQSQLIALLVKLPLKY